MSGYLIEGAASLTGFLSAAVGVLAFIGTQSTAFMVLVAVGLFVGIVFAAKLAIRMVFAELVKIRVLHDIEEAEEDD